MSLLYLASHGGSQISKFERLSDVYRAAIAVNGHPQPFTNRTSTSTSTIPVKTRARS